MSKVYKLPFIIKKDGGRSFLIVAPITRVKYLDTNLSILIRVPWRNCITTLIKIYPEAPVPKSIAITCVNKLSSFSKAMFK